MATQYLITIPLSTMAVGAEYPPGAKLPPHCTVVQWFFEGRGFDLLELEYQLSELASRIRMTGLVLESSNLDFFGPHGDVPVHVLSRNKKLNLAHTETLLILSKMNSIPAELGWIGAGYRAHVTNVPGFIFSPGKTFIAEQLVLMSRDESRMRRVESVFDIRTMHP